MKRLVQTLVLSAALVIPLAPTSSAYADPVTYHGGYEDDCRGGGCGNEREEDYSGANCKYVCPQFDRSPVQDAFNFNPQICLPGATCHFEDRERQDRQPEEQQPAN